jgi:carboxypeptidase Taq
MSNYEKFAALSREIKTREAIAGLLVWDRETGMPKGGQQQRSIQLAGMSGEILEMKTSPEYVSLLNELMQQLPEDPVKAGNIQLAWKNCEKARKLDRKFTEAYSMATSELFNEWAKGRESGESKSFLYALDAFRPLLLEKCERIAGNALPYDALLDEFEPGMTQERLNPVMDELEEGLREILKSVKLASELPKPITERVPVAKQIAFAHTLAEHVGFDLNRGRLDAARHPFCLALSPNDVRLTYRADENNPGMLIWGTLHELGHGLYEQGLNESQAGLASGSVYSLTMHESMSRFWENYIGKSKGFWNFIKDRHGKDFPIPDVLEMVNRLNAVSPGFIRIESDELTYHFHILLRYSIEREWVSGRLDTKDIPEFWNDKMERLLGLRPATHAQGFMQDIHWAHGSFGYFPTYTTGSLLAAHWAAHLEQAGILPQEEYEEGTLGEVLDWFRSELFSKGSLQTPWDLCAEVTGNKFEANAFLSYLRKKVVQ